MRMEDKVYLAKLIVRHGGLLCVRIRAIVFAPDKEAAEIKLRTKTKIDWTSIQLVELDNHDGIIVVEGIKRGSLDNYFRKKENDDGPEQCCQS